MITLASSGTDTVSTPVSPSETPLLVGVDEARAVA
jgi:hypothetical protein